MNKEGRTAFATLVHSTCTNWSCIFWESDTIILSWKLPFSGPANFYISLKLRHSCSYQSRQTFGNNSMGERGHFLFNYFCCLYYKNMGGGGLFKTLQKRYSFWYLRAHRGSCAKNWFYWFYWFFIIRNDSFPSTMVSNQAPPLKIGEASGMVEPRGTATKVGVGQSFVLIALFPSFLLPSLSTPNKQQTSTSHARQTHLPANRTNIGGKVSDTCK